MGVQSLSFSFNQSPSLQDFVSKLISKYDPVQLICFGFTEETVSSKSCFGYPAANDTHHFFLLMLTKGRPPREKKVQNWAERNYEHGKITLLVQDFKCALKPYLSGASFTAAVRQNGTVLYAADQFPAGKRVDDAEIYLSIKLGARIDKASYHKELAEGCYEAAGSSLEAEHWSTSVFLYSEALQQYCLALTRLYLNVNPKFHNPMQLLDLCKCYTMRLSGFFRPEITEDHRLSTYLVEIRNMVHYGTDIEPDMNVTYYLDEVMTQFRGICLELFDFKVKELEEMT
ncbi:MAG: hypothetical protein ACO1NS_05700 [Daejeonella sp.]